MNQIEQIVYHLKMSINLGYEFIGKCTKWVAELTQKSMKQIMGENNWDTIKQFIKKHAVGCFFGSIVVFACIFQYRQRNKFNKDLAILSDMSKGKKQVWRRKVQKLKLIKFASEQEGNNEQKVIEKSGRQNYDSTLQSKNNLNRRRSQEQGKEGQMQEEYGRQQQDKQKEYDREEEYSRILESEIGMLQKRVLEDSKSDKIFNEMYGVYQASFQ